MLDWASSPESTLATAETGPSNDCSSPSVGVAALAARMGRGTEHRHYRGRIVAAAQPALDCSQGSCGQSGPVHRYLDTTADGGQHDASRQVTNEHCCVPPTAFDSSSTPCVAISQRLILSLSSYHCLTHNSSHYRHVISTDVHLNW